MLIIIILIILLICLFISSFGIYYFMFDKDEKNTQSSNNQTSDKKTSNQTSDKKSSTDQFFEKNANKDSEILEYKKVIKKYNNLKLRLKHGKDERITITEIEVYDKNNNQLTLTEPRFSHPNSLKFNNGKMTRDNPASNAINKKKGKDVENAKSKPKKDGYFQVNLPKHINIDDIGKIKFYLNIYEKIPNRYLTTKIKIYNDDESKILSPIGTFTTNLKVWDYSTNKWISK